MVNFKLKKKQYCCASFEQGWWQFEIIIRYDPGKWPIFLYLSYNDNHLKIILKKINWGPWQIATKKWPWLFPSLPFILFVMWLCSYLNQKVNSAFPPFVLGLTLWLALTNGTEYKWSDSCKPRFQVALTPLLFPQELFSAFMQTSLS